ncbi:TetR/AcrR family transcriptional regulator [Nocardioides sp. LHD-245]|uniref:TetR/AcrR family transcriptional regulator n=1 Tax=Nocardioides sp. LHD-245 TaxID=3051387 RepID=UPI0027E15243|nr:TetR/AcrR family transcriptional regulator [Nocardioides sp. LHD-245]
MTSGIGQAAATGSLSGVRERTRRAIVDTAVALWSRDWNASLGEVATGAQVSRSTLHRYFPDRQSLVLAARDHALLVLGEAAGAAVQGCASAAEELAALLRAIVDVGDAVIYLYADPARFGGSGADDQDDSAELREVVVRAAEEGAIDASAGPDWVIAALYSIGYAAAEAINHGTLPRSRAGDVAVRTFLRGVGRDDG